MFIPVNIIGDTAIDGMRAMAGYDYLLVFLWWLAGYGGGLLSLWWLLSILAVVPPPSVPHPPAIGACTFLSVPDAFPYSSLAVPDHTPSAPPPPAAHPISARDGKRVEALWVS